MSASCILNMSPGLGSKLWDSTPGGRRRVTSAFFFPIFFAKSYRGKRVVTTLRLFSPVIFEVFFSQEIMKRDKESITMSIFTNLDFMILLFNYQELIQRLHSSLSFRVSSLLYLNHRDGCSFYP